MNGKLDSFSQIGELLVGGNDVMDGTLDRFSQIVVQGVWGTPCEFC